MSDEITEAEIAAFMEQLADSARKDIIPKMRSSFFCITVLAPDGIDPYLALQLGLALLLEKPLIIIAVHGVWIPERVRRLADAVIEGVSPSDPAMQEALKDAILRLQKKYGVGNAV